MVAAVDVVDAALAGSMSALFNYRDTTPLSRPVTTPRTEAGGMVLRVDVVDAALQAAYPNGERPRIVLLSPTGRLLDDELADELTAEPHVALLCGRYEGFDERVHEHFADDEVSIGRYVLAGGELPAMVVADVVMRKLPGALGHEQSAVEESFSRVLEGMPEYPHYTRPPATEAGRCPRSWSPATTSGSASGGSSRAARGPSSSKKAPSRYHSADRAAPDRARRFFLARL